MSEVTNQKTASSADWHRADVVAALHKKGWSLRELSRQSGLNAGTLKSALDRPYPKGEQIIASAIGISAMEIWPQRYQKRLFAPLLRCIATRGVAASGGVA
ncbi:Ner family transcriptional regulator [Duganella sp. SG902]|uniref:helix-turn-helix domain-containing protein n=1 Tax=Duganella sp. SG902 TaxID=2587016 RepID=UPI00159DF5D1|nr:helix-turn-helix domain-containing protein [Duganella sp. SG902]NVM78871.1 Ner family transcriptional regulator [Duganella sp. SG902]